MTTRTSLGPVVVALACALVHPVAEHQASLAQEVPDLTVNSGETYTMLPDSGGGR